MPDEKVEGQVEGQVEGTEGQQQSGGEGRTSGEADVKPPKDGNWIPKHRFDEVNQGYTKYKELGNPDEIKKSLNRLKELEALPQNRTTDKEKSEIRKELLSVFPELQTMTNMLELQREAYTERGAAVNNDFLKEIGIEANEANNKYLQELLSGVIAADPKLVRRFWAMDPNVFTEAFAIAKKTFWPNVRKVVPGAQVQSKKIPPKAPSQQKSGEGEQKKDPNAPLSRMDERAALDAASEEAFALLESSRSE
jgi:hypothetical protein